MTFPEKWNRIRQTRVGRILSMKRLSNNGRFNQFAAGFIASLSFGMCSACYVWINPILTTLISKGSPVPMTRDQLGWVTSLPEIGSVISPVFAGFLADRFGRRNLLIANAPIQIITWIAVAFIHNVYAMYFIRLVQGFLVGAVGTVLPLYLAETADVGFRGRICVLSAMGWNLGCLYEYVLGFLDYYPLIWANIALPLGFMITFMFFHESPYYLVLRGRRQEAIESLKSFRNLEEPINEELERIEEEVMNERKAESSWRDLITTSEGLKGLWVVIMLNVTFNMSGAMSVISYCTKTFKIMSGVQLSSAIFTVGMGAGLSVVPVITMFFIDKYGRRILLLISYGGSFICLILVAIFFVLKEKSSIDPTSWVILPVIGLILYPPMISFGAMIIAHMYQAELFSNSTRSLASAVGIIIGAVFASLSIQIYQPMEDYGEDYITYFMYTAFALAGFIFTYLTTPETKGKSFEEIQQQFRTTNLFMFWKKNKVKNVYI